MTSFLKRRLQDNSIIGSPAPRRTRVLCLWNSRRARALFSHVVTAVLFTLVVPLQSCRGQVTEPGPSYEVPAAIDATGTNDVTTDLLAFFASVPDGSTISFPAGAIYRIENTLLVKNRNNLTFEGNGATLIAKTDGSGVTPDPVQVGPPGTWPRQRRHWRFWGGSGIVLRNMTIQGAHPSGGLGGYIASLEAQHGIDFGGVVGGAIDGVTITDVYGDFILLGKTGPSSPTWTSNVSVTNSTGIRNGRQAIAISGAQDVLIENNNFSQMARTVLDIEPDNSTSGAKRITFRNNTIGPASGNFISNVGSGLATVEDITVENNVLTGTAIQMLVGSPTASTRRARFTIRNNTSNLPFNSVHSLMVFYRTDNIVVTGNTNPMQAGSSMIGVQTQEVCEPQVSGNTFLNAVQEWQDTPWTGCP